MEMIIYFDSTYRDDIQMVRKHMQHFFGSFNGKQLVVIGATGQIGSCFIDMLLEDEGGAEHIDCMVFAVGRSRPKMERRFSKYRNDPRLRFVAYNVLHAASDDVLFHSLSGVKERAYWLYLASNTHPKQYREDPIRTIALNTIGLKNALNLASMCKAKRFLFASSCEVYGEPMWDTDPCREDYFGYIDCNTLRAGYPESKRCGEALCQAYASMYGMEIVIPRYARVYGPTMSREDTRAVAQFIWNAVDGKDVILKSDGTQEYSYIYGVDAASATAVILTAGKPGEAYNVADLWQAGDVKLYGVALSAAKAAGKIVVKQRTVDDGNAYTPVKRSLLNPGKLELLGWEHWFSLHDGINRTVKSLKFQKEEQ